MKLEQAIIMGRFYGLQSVEECYYNSELHYFSFLPFTDVKGEREELVVFIQRRILRNRLG